MEKEKYQVISPLYRTAAATAKSLQPCPTLCDPINVSPPGSPVSGILQARTLEWAAISFSSAWQWKVKVKSLSRVQLLATPWTAAHQAPLSMGFSRQEYWSGVPLPSPYMEQNPPNKWISQTKQRHRWKEQSYWRVRVVERVRWMKRINCMVMDGNPIFGGENTPFSVHASKI